MAVLYSYQRELPEFHLGLANSPHQEPTRTAAANCCLEQGASRYIPLLPFPPLTQIGKESFVLDLS